MKKIVALVSAAAVAASLAGCGSAPAASAAAPASSAAASAAATVDLTGDGYAADVDYAALAGTTITIAASPAPHAPILGVVKDILAAANITLDIQEYDDYVVPNNVVESGEVYANYFQHQPYLDDFNAENGTHLVSVAGIHVEPMAVYAGKTDSLDAIADGAQIAVPNDTTNEARALALLQESGLITLDPAAGITATKTDITENPHNIDVVEVEAAQIPNILQDVDFGVINGNYAVESGLNPTTDSVAIEGSASDYVNVLVVKEGNEATPETKALIAALQSDAVRTFIADTYTDGSVIAVF